MPEVSRQTKRQRRANRARSRGVSRASSKARMAEGSRVLASTAASSFKASLDIGIPIVATYRNRQDSGAPG